MNRSRWFWVSALMFSSSLVPLWVGSATWDHDASAAGPSLSLSTNPSVEAPIPTVSALGRLEPKGGTSQIYGPADPVVVVRELLVEEGDLVQRGQILATLDGRDRAAARLARSRAKAAEARARLAEAKRLFEANILERTAFEERETAVQVTEAEDQIARIDYQRSAVYAPRDGKVLEIYTRLGERVGERGLLELGGTKEMTVVAEVYESDARRIRKGQSARMTSPALAAPVVGVVERIGAKVGQARTTEDAPSARVDARIIEVLIAVEDDGSVANYTNLQLDVEIDLGLES